MPSRPPASLDAGHQPTTAAAGSRASARAAAPAGIGSLSYSTSVASVSRIRGHARVALHMARRSPKSESVATPPGGGPPAGAGAIGAPGAPAPAGGAPRPRALATAAA